MPHISVRKTGRKQVNLKALLIKGDIEFKTETINVSEHGVLLKKPKALSDTLLINERLQIQIFGFKKDTSDTDIHEAILVRTSLDTLALEFI